MSGPDHRRADNGAARVGDVVARSSEPTLPAGGEPRHPFMPIRRTQRDATSGSELSTVPETHESLASAMEGLAVHDHLCLIYESQAAQFAAVVPFMRHGLAVGQACMYIADDN